VYTPGRINDEPIEPRKMVDSLRKAPNVEIVVFDGVSLMDASFRDIATYAPKLRQLGLRKTKVTPDAIAEFKTRRPDVEVVVR
jgi:hypothetical protein